jgi:hypothetical protein
MPLANPYFATGGDFRFGLRLIVTWEIEAAVGIAGRVRQEISWTAPGFILGKLQSS